MADLEDIFDQLAVEMAKTPEERARLEGFIQGKNHARRETVYLAVAIAVLAFVFNVLMENLT